MSGQGIPGAEQEYYRDLRAFLAGNPHEAWTMAVNFPKYIDRQHLSKYLVRHELFKLVTGVTGAIVEGGVYNGGGLMLWAQLSALYEPYNHLRRIIGFDTFAGLPQPTARDVVADTRRPMTQGQFACTSKEELEQAIALYDRNRPLGHVPRVELVAGDATATIPAYVAAHPHLLVALLCLDFDLYEPTRAALSCLLPRMPRGAVILCDEIANPRCPGETAALLEEAGAGRLRLQRFPFEPEIGYAVLD